MPHIIPRPCHLATGPAVPTPPAPWILGLLHHSPYNSTSLSPPSLCSHPHRLLSNNKITVLQNGSFFGLRVLEKL